MFYPLTACIGLRYIRAHKKARFVSFISAVSLLGITLGVTALITVLSVVNGFDQEIKNRILAMTPHITLYGLHGSLSEWETLQTELQTQPQVLHSTPFIEGHAMLTAQGTMHFAWLQGVLPEQESAVSTIAQKMREGHLDDLKPGNFGVILGAGLAEQLGVHTGDYVTIILPDSNLQIMGIQPRIKRLAVKGICALDFKTDRTLALVHMQDAATLYRMGDSVSGLRIRTPDLYQAPAVAKQLSWVLGGDYLLTDWTEQNAAFFATLRMEKRITFLMLALIIAVAAFNILATLVMIVTEKRAQIAILRTMGAEPGHILRIFMVQGTLIGCMGTATGAACGIALATYLTPLVSVFEQLFGVTFISREFYYIGFLPTQLVWEDVFWVSALSLGISFLATLYPAWQAAQLQPAEALRYE